MIKNINILGVFGGASLNSVELALVSTDGIDLYEIKKSAVVPYPEALCLKLRAILNQRVNDLCLLENDENIQNLKDEITDFYVETINDFCSSDEYEEIGIDGLTIYQSPEDKCSYQLEWGSKLQKRLNRRLVTHFHKADLLSGGQASPLTAAFCNAGGEKLVRPSLFIDLEAVSSLIYLGESGEMVAYDCAPGLATIEDWTFRHANMLTDYNGRLAITGKIHQQVVDFLLNAKILHKEPPKSMDILDFRDKKEHFEGLSLEDGAATITSFIAQAIYQATEFLPQIPNAIYVTGEGTKNPSLMRFLRQEFANFDLKNVSQINPDVTAFGAISTAFNTARRLYGLPITFPSTTGAYEPMIGGEIYE